MDLIENARAYTVLVSLQEKIIILTKTARYLSLTVIPCVSLHAVKVSSLGLNTRFFLNN